jgi:hypothetical protein
MKRFDNLLTLGLTFLLSPLGALAQVVPSDQGNINLRDSNTAVRRATARPVRLTVAPNGQSPIAMATLPNAVCSLHLEGETTRSIKLFADEEGIVRFHAGGSAEANLATQFVLDCAADGATQSFPLELRPNSVPTEDMPAPAQEVRKPRPGAFVQPALTGSEAASLSAEELATRGYPRRPDREDSKARATWLKAVTQPMTFVPAKQVANPEITHGARCCGQPYASNWSGFQLQGPTNQSSSYALVTGTWNVPAVTGAPNGPVAYSAFWIGLDGFNTFTPVPTGLSVDLVQAGTEQNAQTMNGVTITNYYAWTEFLPQDPFEVVLPNFLVQPGDEIICSVWIGTAQSNLPATLSGQFAWFSIHNVTRSEFTLISESRGYISGATGERVPHGIFETTNVQGFEAEWIMERPTVNGILPDLADYGKTAMTGAHAQLNNSSTLVPADISTILEIKMVSGFDSLGHPAGNLLSSPAGAKTCPTVLTCTIIPDEVLFTWSQFH